MRLSRPLGFGVTWPEGSSFSSEDRVVEESARSSGGALVGAAVLMAGALGLEDQKAGMVKSEDDRIAMA